MNEENKQIDILGKLNSIRDKYLSAKEKEKSIYKEMNNEVKEATEKIKLSYQEKINSCESDISILKKELDHYKSLIANYSTFDSKMIGEIIEKLVSLVEGEKYSYQMVKHETYEYQWSYFGREIVPVINRVLMIVKDSLKQEYYCDYDADNNKIEKLVEKKHAFVLAKNEYYFYKTIQFYKANEGIIESLVDFNKFSYVKEFIDSVIQYRFQNDLEKITETNLLALMKQFVLSKREMIENNYQERFLEKQEELKQQLIAEQLSYNDKLSQMELENLLKNGVPSTHSNNLIDRLHETISKNAEFNNDMCKLEILYGGDAHNAIIVCDETLISLENIFISKINIECSIKDYFDVTDPDPHFHGFCNIDLVDDGLIGIVDISSLKQDLDNIVNLSSQYKPYKIDRINDEYLRILYLPNKGEYKHKSENIYSWILEKKSTENLENKPTSYKTNWDSSEEAEKMLTYLKEIELLSNLDEKQLKLYKQRKKS